MRHVGFLCLFYPQALLYCDECFPLFPAVSLCRQIMDHSAPVQWDDIAGLQFAKATIKEIVVWPMLRP